MVLGTSRVASPRRGADGRPSPDMDGIEATRRMPKQKVLILTT
jgi:hypothetical protein